MIQEYSIEFWVAFQMFIDLILIVMVLYFFGRMRSSIKGDASKEASESVLNIIEPLLIDARNVAGSFEIQLKEKNRVINNLNKRLDARIISLNLLLNRTEGNNVSGLSDEPINKMHVYDQQEAIMKLYRKGYDAKLISSRLSMPRGEVDLVIDLKKKFLKLEKRTSGITA